jgi:hypothetical protein
MDEEDDEDPVAEPVQEEVEEEDDEDPFAALGVGGPAVALSTLDEDDPLAALMDDEEDEEDEDEGEDEPAVEVEEENTSSAIDAKAAYLMVLETVWVDGVLDPGEVSLLARRRKELGLSFEEHLALVRKMLG